jgi:hypothetical protein
MIFHSLLPFLAEQLSLSLGFQSFYAHIPKTPNSRLQKQTQYVSFHSIHPIILHHNHPSRRKKEKKNRVVYNVTTNFTFQPSPFWATFLILLYFTVIFFFFNYSSFFQKPFLFFFWSTLSLIMYINHSSTSPYHHPTLHRLHHHHYYLPPNTSRSHPVINPNLLPPQHIFFSALISS